MKYVAARPPAKKPRTAINEGNPKLARPEIAWPDVHPPAYAVPNPTRNPPKTTDTNPRRVNRACQLKISCGATPDRSWSPNGSVAIRMFER